MIIHISGSSSSGKTTIGNKLLKKFGNKIVVIDTDDLQFNPATIAKYWKELDNTKTCNDAKKVWRKLIKRSIDDVIKKYSKKIIIFVGLLQSSFGGGCKNIMYDIPNINYKFFLDVPINILLERYYKRLCNNLQNTNKKENDKYWLNISEDKQYIMGSQNIIETHKRNITYAKKYNYKIMKDDDIIYELKKILLYDIK